MITLRMLAIAAAILIGTPLTFALADHAIGHVTMPGGEAIDADGRVGAIINDVALVDPPATYARAVRHNGPEQLVEGHTVFVTWDIPLIRQVQNWSADVVGYVECTDHVNVSGEKVLGLPIWPTEIHEAHVECAFGDTVVMTPDPFWDSADTTGSAYSVSPAGPTGRRLPFDTPMGVPMEAIEHEYLVYGTDWLGNDFARVQYAWEVPIIESWTHTDGKPRNFYCPIPEEKLVEMGLEQFLVFHKADSPDWLRFAQVQGAP